MRGLIPVLSAALLWPGVLHSAAPNLTVGQCVTSRIKSVTQRPGGGVSLTYDNGVLQDSAKPTPAMKAAKAGDPVALCVGRIASGCALGGGQDIAYHAKSLRTGETWFGSNSLHGCNAK